MQKWKSHSVGEGSVMVVEEGTFLDGHVKFLIDRRVSVCNFRMQ